MAKVPNAASAVIAPSKITHYLLKWRSKDDKSQYFMSLGFTQQKWTELRDALLRHPLDNDYVATGSGVNGVTFEVQCNLRTPDGRNPCIRSIWQIDRGTSVPKLVTAYP
jgi:hypothetical protein